MARRDPSGRLPDGGPLRRRITLTGCLLWIAIVLAILVVLAVLFGGFQKGTKVGVPAAVMALSQPPT